MQSGCDESPNRRINGRILGRTDPGGEFSLLGAAGGVLRKGSGGSNELWLHPRSLTTIRRSPSQHGPLTRFLRWSIDLNPRIARYCSGSNHPSALNSRKIAYPGMVARYRPCEKDSGSRPIRDQNSRLHMRFLGIVKRWRRLHCGKNERGHTFCIGPGYCDTQGSAVSRVMPSTVACATRIRSKGSLWIGGRLSMATACSLLMGSSL